MKKKLRFMTIMLICIVLFLSEFYRMNVFANNLENDKRNISEQDVQDKNSQKEPEKDSEENSDEGEENFEEDQEESGEGNEEESKEDKEMTEEKREEKNEDEKQNFGEEDEKEGAEESEKKEIIIRKTEEVIQQEETVTFFFDNLYGKGTYKILEEGSEWKEATGSTDIILTENSNVTIQVKADNGYFIVSDYEEEQLEQMQIELSWENKGEFENYRIKFESKVTGCIDLDSNKGAIGNEFMAQINISDNIDMNNMYCKWNYEENDIELLTNSSSLDENYKFRVIKSEDKVIRISAEIYRGDVRLGTLTSTDYTISAIDIDMLLSHFTAQISDSMDIDLMSTGECVIGGKINFIAELNTSYIKSLDYKVEEVIVTYASNAESMTGNTDGQYAKSVNIQQTSLEICVPKIKIVFFGGIEATVSAKKTLRLDKEAPLVNVSLVDGNNVIKKEWLSQNDGYENLQLKIDVKDVSNISRCTVTSSNSTGTSIMNKINNSYYVKVDLKEQITDYTIFIEDAGGNYTEVIYTLKVDNTNPSEEIKVSFSGKQEIICEEEIKAGYYLGEGQGNVYSDGHVTMNFEVTDDVDSSKVSSGISKVVVTVLVATADGEQEQKYILKYNGKSEENLSFCINKNQPEPEMIFQIKQVFLEDQAGNSVELLKEDECVDAVKYFIDGRAPFIEYKYPGGTVDTESEDIIYYQESSVATVEISDLNLSQYQINVENVNEYEKTEIKKETSGDTKEIYSLALNKDGKYQICTEANFISRYRQNQDNAKENSKTMIVDTLVPVIEVKLFNDKGTELTHYANGFYNETIKVQIYVVEKNVDLIKVTAFCDGNLKNIYTEDDFETSLQEGSHLLTCNLSEEGEYHLEVICKDKTGKEAKFQSETFTIDKTAPKVTITYDNNDAKNEFYFNAERIATIEVEDASFDRESIKLNIESAKNNKPALSGWSESGRGKEKVYTAQVRFTRDDIYDVSFCCEDLAGNHSEEYDGGHFVIDRTSPVIHIEYDNYSSKNEIYYKENRTAFITVEDISFDEDSFTVSNAGEENVVSVNNSGNWNGSDISHMTEIICSEEGAYHFSIYAEDLAGNGAAIASSEYFIIDKTAPEIKISGITHESANQGDVVPVISYKDKYLDDDYSVIELSGYKNGIISVSTKVTSEKDSRSVQYDVFPKTREMDDVYTLKVHIEDKAGNESEEEYLFSVNRFGSTFSINKSTAELVASYYTNIEQDIVITEVNVDNLEQEEITVSFNGEPRTLNKNTDYIITSQGSSATWKSYTYTIYKKNFEKEGQYIVSVFSKDTADNQSDNNAQDIEIAFAVDKTAPSIVVTNLEANGVYTQSQLSFHMDIKDNMCLESANLFVNGKEVQFYTQEELKNAVSYKLEESDKPVNIIIRATDIVGNTSEKKFSNIRINQVIETVEKEEATEGDMLAGKSNQTLAQMNILRMVVIAMPVTAVLLVISAVGLRKKKERKKT